MSFFQHLVTEELKRVRDKVRPFNSFHESYGKLCEEVAEYFEEVRLKSKKDPENTLLELIQIAGVCQRSAEDLLMDLLQSKKSSHSAAREAEWDSLL